MTSRTPGDGLGTQVGFAEHIKPLFREFDRNAMRKAFDLWAYDDVVRHAPAILDQVRSGSMPCDGPWPESQVALFSQWVSTGTAP
jgi:hypothetical protein